MNRIAYVVFKKSYIAPFWYRKIKKYAKSDKYSIEEKYNLVREIIIKVNKSCKVDIICSGKENLPEENGYILFPNHQGLFDVLLTIETHDRPLSFVIKKEMENTILIKDIIALLNGKTLDRNDVRQSMGVISQVTKEVKEGANYIIFPEGTRSKIPNVPGEFKAGTFKSAVKAKAPIVPVALIDAYKPFDVNSTDRVTVQIHYLKPLLYDEYKEMKTVDIAKEVQRRIENKIKEIIG